MDKNKKNEVVIFENPQTLQKGGLTTHTTPNQQQNSDELNKQGGEEKPNEQNLEKIDELLKESGMPLLSIKTNFPLDPWPNELKITPESVNITINEFFSTSYTRSVLIDNIALVTAEKAPIWSTLEIVDFRDPGNPILFRPVNPKDAEKARDIIQGLILSKKQQIDVTQLPEKEEVEKVEQLGKIQQG